MLTGGNTCLEVGEVARDSGSAQGRRRFAAGQKKVLHWELCHCILEKSRENRDIVLPSWQKTRSSFPNPAIPSPCSDGFFRKTPKDGDSSKTETGIVAAGTGRMNSDRASALAQVRVASTGLSWPWFMRGREAAGHLRQRRQPDSRLESCQPSPKHGNQCSQAKFADSEQKTASTRLSWRWFPFI